LKIRLLITTNFASRLSTEYPNDGDDLWVQAKSIHRPPIQLSSHGFLFRSITNASATDLSFIVDESCDAVLMLGPFYNLSLGEERRKAASEACRILRKGGLLFAAGINRMIMLHWIYSDGPESILEERAWLEPYVRTGDFPSQEAGVPSIWHLTTIAEFRADFPDFQEIVLAGVESFARGHEANLLKLSSQQAEVWLDLIEETGRTPEGQGMTGHFLYIGRK
jgi:Methyltransferase domain